MMNAFVNRLEPEVWCLVDEILQRVPEDIDVARYRTDAELIDALGRAGAFDALRVYQVALERYYAGIVFWALRAATIRPMVADSDRRDVKSFDFEELFEVPW